MHGRESQRSMVDARVVTYILCEARQIATVYFLILMPVPSAHFHFDMFEGRRNSVLSITVTCRRVDQDACLGSMMLVHKSVLMARYKGSIKDLWAQMDRDRSGFITLKEVSA